MKLYPISNIKIFTEQYDGINKDDHYHHVLLEISCPDRKTADRLEYDLTRSFQVCQRIGLLIKPHELASDPTGVVDLPPDMADRVRAGQNTPAPDSYLPRQELGSDTVPIRPFMKDALEKSAADFRQVIEKALKGQSPPIDPRKPFSMSAHETIREGNPESHPSADFAPGVGYARAPESAADEPFIDPAEVEKWTQAFMRPKRESDGSNAMGIACIGTIVGLAAGAFSAVAFDYSWWQAVLMTMVCGSAAGVGAALPALFRSRRILPKWQRKELREFSNGRAQGIPPIDVDKFCDSIGRRYECVPAGEVDGIQTVRIVWETDRQMEARKRRETPRTK